LLLATDARFGRKESSPFQYYLHFPFLNDNPPHYQAI
jgi:hypothetical protein